MVQKKDFRVALDTVGCKLNQAETEYLSRELATSGYILVSPHAKADAYILNTCTVTHIADRKSRHLLRMARERNPNAMIIATGCYAQRALQELANIEEIDLVLDNKQKQLLPQVLQELFPVKVKDSTNQYYGLRSRSFVKIHDGCTNFCSYCIVPLVRGKEKSLPYEKVLAEIKQRQDDGYKELVLTGTEIGSYQHGGIDLKQLLERILAETSIPRLRLSSLQPQEIYPDFLELWHDPRLCRHFHLSLQSGSDGVLQRMNRRYSTSDYRKAVSAIRKIAPEVAITTDVIAGFPGETDAEFKESHAFCRKTEFARIHVFPFSPRRGTLAAQMPWQINAETKKERTRKMLSLAEESAMNFRQHFLDSTMPVLWEKQSAGIWSGHTDNYIKLYTRSKEEMANQVLPVRLLKLYRDGVWGI